MSKKSKDQEFKINLPSLKALLTAGVHLGHQKKRWFPGTAPFIFDTQKNVHIIDLGRTRQRLEEACQFLAQTASEGGAIIFLGTKRQAAALVKQAAKDCGAMYITERWFGGFLTNFKKIKESMTRLKDLEEKMKSGEFDKYTKKERLLIDRQIAKLERLVGGVRDLGDMPAALFIIDVRREKTAVAEARQMGVPIVALIDTNSDPEGIDYPIPGNDDAAKSIKIIVETVAGAVRIGSQESGVGGRKKQETGGSKLEARKDAGTPNQNKFGSGQGSTLEKKKDQDGGKKAAQKISELGLSNRAKNALEKAGIKTVTELKKLSDEEFDKIKGLGKKSLDEIKEIMKRIS